MQVIAYSKETVVPLKRFLEFFCSTNMAGTAEIITAQPSLAAFFGLHWIVASNK